MSRHDNYRKDVTDEYRDGWERIFAKSTREHRDDALMQSIILGGLTPEGEILDGPDAQ